MKAENKISIGHPSSFFKAFGQRCTSDGYIPATSGIKPPKQDLNNVESIIEVVMRNIDDVVPASVTSMQRPCQILNQSSLLISIMANQPAWISDEHSRILVEAAILDDFY